MSTVRHRGEGGFTLVEVLLVVAISSAIMVPLLGWMIVGLRTEETVVRSSARELSQNLLADRFPADVAAARSVVIGGGDCVGVAPSRTVVLQLTRPTGSVVYALVPGEQQLLVLQRSECAPDGTLTATRDLASGIVAPAATGVSVTCETVASRPADACVRVVLSAQTDDGRIAVTGYRRAGVDR